MMRSFLSAWTPRPALCWVGLTVLDLLAANALANPVSITAQTGFRDMTDAGYDDSSETDNGGHLTFYVRNDGAEPCPASVGIGETRRLSYTYGVVPDGGSSNAERATEFQWH